MFPSVCPFKTSVPLRIFVSSLRHRNLQSASNLCVEDTRLIEALRYRPEGLGFDSLWCQWNFSMTISRAALWAWNRLRNISRGQWQPVCRSDNLTTFLCLFSWNLGFWTSCRGRLVQPQREKPSIRGDQVALIFWHRYIKIFR